MLQSGFCVIFGRGGKLFGCFEGNFENTGRMEMFSIPGESDLVESFVWPRTNSNTIVNMFILFKKCASYLKESGPLSKTP